MNERVLIIDDQARSHQFVKQILGNRFAVDIAESGKEAIELLAEQPPYLAVISELRLSDMSAGSVLQRVVEKSSHTIRLVVTSFQRLDWLGEAINQGKIDFVFRKPISGEQLMKAIESGIAKRQEAQSRENDVSQTVQGSVTMMRLLLKRRCPLLFHNSIRICEYVRRICYEMKLTNRWECEKAAELAQVGAVAVPTQIFLKVRNRQALDQFEEQLIQSIPRKSHDLIHNVPRLQDVAKIVLHQQEPFIGLGSPLDSHAPQDIPLGSRILKVAADYESLISTGATSRLVLEELRGRHGAYDPQILTILEKIEGNSPSAVTKPSVAGHEMSSDVVSRRVNFIG